MKDKKATYIVDSHKVDSIKYSTGPLNTKQEVVASLMASTHKIETLIPRYVEQVASLYHQANQHADLNACDLHQALPCIFCSFECLRKVLFGTLNIFEAFKKPILFCLMALMANSILSRLHFPCFLLLDKDFGITYVLSRSSVIENYSNFNRNLAMEKDYYKCLTIISCR